MHTHTSKGLFWIILICQYYIRSFNWFEYWELHLCRWRNNWVMCGILELYFPWSVSWKQLCFMIILLVCVMTTEAAYHKSAWFFGLSRILAPLSVGWQQSTHHALPHTVINQLVFIGESVTKVMTSSLGFE